MTDKSEGQVADTGARCRFDIAKLADGGRAYLAMVSSHGRVSALALVRDEGRTCFDIASGLLEESAIRCQSRAILRRLTRRPLSGYVYNRFGPHIPVRRGVVHLLDSMRNYHEALDGEAHHIRVFGSEKEMPPPDEFLGFVHDIRRDCRPPPFVLEGPVQRSPAKPGSLAAGLVFPLQPQGKEAEYMEAWLGSLSRDFQPGHGLRLGPEAWSPEAVTFLAAPGRVGEWRRQAAALQPAFIQTIVHDAALRALVDAGEPFEGRLLDLIRLASEGDTHSEPVDPDGLTLAKISRLRTYPAPLFKNGRSAYMSLIRPLSRAPIGNVPRTRDGWRGFDDLGRQVIGTLSSAGLAVGPALRGVPPEWDIGTSRAGDDPYTALQGMGDMAERFLDTFLRPACGPAMPFALAMNLLFSGDAFSEMVRRQREWHRDLHRMVPIIDPPRHLEWPAMFAPFRLGDVEIRCLTTSEELAAEGCAGPDAEGMAGLDHCVAGYASDCFAGKSHIASITAPGYDGGRVRIATLELIIKSDGLAIEQLMGRANAKPVPLAKEAAKALVDAIYAGTHPYDREAMRFRDPPPPHDPATLDLPAIHAAWLPHLPPSAAIGDLDAFRGLVRDRIEALSPFGAPKWPPQPHLSEGADVHPA